MKKTKKPSKRTKFVPARSPKARAKQKAAIRKYYTEKKPKNSLTKQDETYPHFRRYKVKEGSKVKFVRHPKLIMGKIQNLFEFIGLTESAKRGHHKNVSLQKNPEKGNKDPSYLRDELRQLPTDRFGEPLTEYKLTKQDEATAWAIYNKNKKK